MRSKKLVSVILLLLVVCLISVVRSAFAQVKPFELSYSVMQPATHPNGVLASEWAREIEKRTNGRIKFTLYYSGTLTSADKIYNGVVSGISDVGQSVLAYTRGKFPLMEVIDLPLGYKTGYIATKLANDFYGKFKPLILLSLEGISNRPLLLLTDTPAFESFTINSANFKETIIGSIIGAPSISLIPFVVSIGDINPHPAIIISASSSMHFLDMLLKLSIIGLKSPLFI